MSRVPVPSKKCFESKSSRPVTPIHKLADVKDDDLAHYRIMARGWTKEGNLLVIVGLNYQYRGVSDWYDYDAVVRMAGSKFELISGEARKVNAWSYSGNRAP